MANLAEFSEYKNRLAETFCSDEIIRDLITSEDNIGIIPKEMMYKYVYPYPYTPDATEKAKSLICFEVNVPNVSSNIIKTVQINVYIITHKNLMRLPDGSGMRVDVIASEVDRILNGSVDYGLGHVDLLSVHGFTPITGYYGRELRYRVKDINRTPCSRNYV